LNGPIIQSDILIRNQRAECCKNNKEGEPTSHRTKPPSDVSGVKIVDVKLAQKENNKKRQEVMIQARDDFPENAIYCIKGHQNKQEKVFFPIQMGMGENGKK